MDQQKDNSTKKFYSSKDVIDHFQDAIKYFVVDNPPPQIGGVYKDTRKKKLCIVKDIIGDIYAVQNPQDKDDVWMTQKRNLAPVDPRDIVKERSDGT